MKKIYILLMALALIIGIANAKPVHVKRSGNKVTSTNSTSLGGVMTSRTLTAGTYTLDSSAFFDVNDTLKVMPGVKVLATGNYNIEIAGTLICNGTNDNPIVFTANDEKTAYDSLGHSGWWGGLLLDSSCLNASVTFTRIDYTGGPDGSGGFQASFDVEGSQSYNGGAKIIFEDNWMFGGMDDAIHLHGYVTVSVKRNILQRLGGPDGDLINIKAGAEGDIAYNYIWSSANSGVKLNTGKTVLSPETKFNIYNNTFVNGNWRKVGELSSAILIDQFSAANIYNNILVGCRNGINVTTHADVNHTNFGNNLIYTYSATTDSFTNNYYIPGSAGSVQTTDKTAAGLDACGTVFTHWDKDITVDTADNNIPTLATNSPAIGAGTTSPTLFTSFSAGARVGSSMAPNVDMGAYPTDNSGNKHLPTKYPQYAGATGISKLTADQGFSVYPNPVIDQLTISWTSSTRGNMKVNILDMQGRVVLSNTTQAANQYTINVSNLSKGLYICRLIQGSTIENSKFLKK
jgi:hypothetical protein